MTFIPSFQYELVASILSTSLLQQTFRGVSGQNHPTELYYLTISKLAPLTYFSGLILRNQASLLWIFGRFLGLRDFGEICMEAQAIFEWENSQFSTKLIKAPTTSLKVKIISNYSGDLSL